MSYHIMSVGSVVSNIANRSGLCLPKGENLGSHQIDY